MSGRGSFEGLFGHLPDDKVAVAGSCIHQKWQTG